MIETLTFPETGRCRVVIEHIEPAIDGGRFALKRVAGETVVVEADVFADGHDSLSVVLQFRSGKEPAWSETPMEFLGNDRWRGNFITEEPGEYFYTVKGWISHFKTWRSDLKKKLQAAQNVSVELQMGVVLIEKAARHAAARDAERLEEWANELRYDDSLNGGSMQRALDESLAELMNRHEDRGDATIYGKELSVTVDRKLARFGAWYELFPRSFSPEMGKHGTFKDCANQLDRVARMGFDVLYLPPIHPIGKSFRKGGNNSVTCAPGEPGSPWAIGAAEGGHKAIHPELGTFEDFARLVDQARSHKIEIALDVAFQCSPDHPYVTEHPEWFLHRSDGSIQYAENPPKKYQDIVPFDFECEHWRDLWAELKSILISGLRAGSGFIAWTIRIRKAFRSGNGASAS